MSVIELPVSLGEALDKLTILDIKLEKIEDVRKIDVQYEYGILYDKLKVYINQYGFFYDILKQVNLDIWEMQDQFRYALSDKQMLCFKIIEYNDRRFRIKQKINNQMKSIIKEQKGYKKKKAFVLTHLGLGDNITAIGMVRYLSTCYDEVYVVCKTKNIKNMKLFYQDDDGIILYPVENDKDVSPNFGFDLNEFKNITDGMDLYLTGCHSLDKKSNDGKIPFRFYTNVGIDTTYFWKYFHIETCYQANSLYDLLKGKKYIFIHNVCSQGEVFQMEALKNKFYFKDDVIVINPCKNYYDNKNNSDLNIRNLCELLLNHPLSFYKKIIINADQIFLCDSSFFCMSINLEINTDQCYYVSRDHVNYDHIFDHKSKASDFKNKKRFIKISL
jgi:hypothetical protein